MPIERKAILQRALDSDTSPSTAATAAGSRRRVDVIAIRQFGYRRAHGSNVSGFGLAERRASFSERSVRLRCEEASNAYSPARTMPAPSTHGEHWSRDEVESGRRCSYLHDVRGRR